MERLGEISAALLDIHELPGAVPFAAFQDQALRRLQAVLPFASAWWGLVSGRQIHTALRFNLPPGYRRGWEPISQHDPIADAALGEPFRTVVFNQSDLSRHEVLNRFLEPYGIRHVLCTVAQQPDLDLHAFLSLYRTDPPFDEEERLIKQAAMPHLTRALANAWRAELEEALHRTANAPRPKAAAICDRSGLVLSADTGFAREMRQEWRDWRGPRLPEVLLAALGGSGGQGGRYKGRAVEVELHPVSDLCLLRVGARDPLTDLTARERMVAEIYAQGATYKAVARDLGLAPATVRHYLRNVYGKLHVTDKAALATLLSRAAGQG